MGKVKPVVLTQRGFRRVHDTLGASNPHPLWLLNCAVDRTTGDAVLRWGWKRTGTALIANHGTAGGAWFGEFVTSTGTITAVAISGGKFYTLDSSGVPSEALSAANLSAASVTLASSGFIYAVPFNGQLVISDGANTPWMWDGTAGSGITKLTNAPVAFGSPTVHYAKLFFIKNTDRGTIVWSEENAANTGYEAGGYNNTWTIAQTGSRTLRAIHGSNEALYYWRAVGIGAIRGAVTSTFSADGTHDGISTEVGLGGVTSYQHHPLAVGGHLWFCDADERPYRLSLGGGPPEPIWEQASRIFLGGTYDGTAYYTQKPFNLGEQNEDKRFQCVRVLYDGDSQTVLFLGTGASGMTGMPVLRFNVTDGAFVGRDLWYGWQNGSAGSIPTYFERPCIVGGSNSSSDEIVGILGGKFRNYVGQDDYGNTETQAITGTIIGPAHGYDEGTEYRFDEIDVVFETNDTTSSSVAVDYLTDQAHYSTLMSASQSVSATDTNYQLKEQNTRLGIFGHGRWIRVRCQLTGTDRIAVKGWRILAYPQSGFPLAVS